ncbi:MAG: type II secretion system minor pseudopilin GspK [Gammaproteobacteria bacterium]
MIASARPARFRAAGVALITVLLVVFLASLTATSLVTAQQLAVRRSTLLLQQQQARLYTLGAEQWAASILTRDRQANATDDLGEEWTALPPALPVEGGAVSGRIEDLSARFNLNNLLKDGTLDPLQLRALQRLLGFLDLNPGIAQAIADWIDPDQDIAYPDGAEDSEYLSRDPPYLTANRPLQSITELRLIKGIDDAVYTKLAPYVAALPSGSAVNLNTAPAPVLAAFLEPLSLEQAQTLVTQRGTEGFDGEDGFRAAAGLRAFNFQPLRLGFTSRHFLVFAKAQVGDARAQLYSVLARADSGAVVALARSYGADGG